MPEFKVFTTIHAPYERVWELASVVQNIEKWVPVKFKNVAPEERVRNGFQLVQLKKLVGPFGCKEMVINDAFTESRVRRQFSIADYFDQFKFNRVTFMIDDNSISTMISLSDDVEAKKILAEQAKTEPKYQINVMAHVFYTMGSSFWRSIAEYLFVTPFFKMLYKKKVESALAKLKMLSEA